jgi:hypothetical protein
MASIQVSGVRHHRDGKEELKFGQLGIRPAGRLARKKQLAVSG